jgi:hypothetical protein
MTFRELLPLVLLVFAICIWWYRAKHRRLMAPEVILEKIYPGETDSIERFSPKEGFDFLVDDKEFWAESRGWKGLRRKRHNAVYFVQFCQGITPDKQLEREELRLMTTRAILIGCYTAYSLPESVVRWFIKDFPHSCARNATYLYWDIERRATTLCSVYRPELLEQLHQIL